MSSPTLHYTFPGLTSSLSASPISAWTLTAARLGKFNPANQREPSRPLLSLSPVSSPNRGRYTPPPRMSAPLWGRWGCFRSAGPRKKGWLTSALFFFFFPYSYDGTRPFRRGRPCLPSTIRNKPLVRAQLGCGELHRRRGTRRSDDHDIPPRVNETVLGSRWRIRWRIFPTKSHSGT